MGFVCLFRQKTNLLVNVKEDEAYHVGEGYKMKTQLAPKSCKLHGIRIKIRRDIAMPRFHDVENDRRLETFTQRHSFALYRTPANLGKKPEPKQTVSEDKERKI